MSYFTSYTDYIREPQEHFHKPRLLFEGDSWFSIPTIANIPLQLESLADLSILCLADPGDTLRELTKGRQFEFLKYITNDEIRGVKWDALVLSAGGNDVIGPEIANLLKMPPNDSKKVEDCLDILKVNIMLQKIKKMLHKLIGIRNKSKANSATPIIVHTYTYLTPRWKAHKVLVWKVSGPWVVPYMEKMGIKDCGMQQAIVKYLLDRYHEVLCELSEAPENNLVVVDTRRALLPVPCDRRDDGDPYWFDEIHPTSLGYAEIAKDYFLPALKRLNIVA